MVSDLENFSRSQLFSTDLLANCPHIVAAELCREKKERSPPRSSCGSQNFGHGQDTEKRLRRLKPLACIYVKYKAAASSL